MISMEHGIDLAAMPATGCVNKNLALVNIGDDEYAGNVENDASMKVIVTYRVHNALGL